MVNPTDRDTKHMKDQTNLFCLWRNNLVFARVFADAIYIIWFCSHFYLSLMDSDFYHLQKVHFLLLSDLVLCKYSDVICHCSLSTSCFCNLQLSYHFCFDLLLLLTSSWFTLHFFLYTRSKKVPHAPSTKHYSLPKSMQHIVSYKVSVKMLFMIGI